MPLQKIVCSLFVGVGTWTHRKINTIWTLRIVGSNIVFTASVQKQNFLGEHLTARKSTTTPDQTSVSLSMSLSSRRGFSSKGLVWLAMSWSFQGLNVIVIQFTWYLNKKSLNMVTYGYALLFNQNSLSFWCFLLLNVTVFFSFFTCSGSCRYSWFFGIFFDSSYYAV